MDSRGWWATVHGVAKSQSQLSMHMQIDLEDIMLSETSQRKTNTVWKPLTCETQKIIQIKVYTNQKQTHKCKGKKEKQWLPKETGKGEGKIGGIELRDSKYYVDIK